MLAVAAALGFERFSVVGQSMGGSVAMKAAELDGHRLDAVVLLDVAGRVDPGVDRDSFVRQGTRGEAVEIHANHLTIATHPDTPAAIRRFLTGANGS